MNDPIDLYKKTSQWIERLKFKLSAAIAILKEGHYNGCSHIIESNAYYTKTVYKFDVSVNLDEPLDAIAESVIHLIVRSYLENLDDPLLSVHSITVKPGDTKLPTAIVYTEVSIPVNTKEETTKCKKKTK